MASPRAHRSPELASKLAFAALAILLLLAASLALSRSGVRPENQALLRPRTLNTQEQLLSKSSALQQLPPSATNVTHTIQPELLDAALRARDDANKIILTFGNAAAFINLFPAMLEGMRFANASGMATHLVAVATSAHAQEICSRFHDNCVLDDWSTSLSAPPRSECQGYDTTGYLDLVWRKPELVRDLINAADINVLCMDMDIVVFKNFLQGWVLPYRSGADILIGYNKRLTGREPPNQERMINSGFSYTRATLPSKALLSAWTHPDVRSGCSWGNQPACAPSTLPALPYDVKI